MQQAPAPPQAPVNSSTSQVPQNRKPHNRNLTSTGRPRGRPPNMNKYLQQAMQNSNVMNQFSKSNFANYLGASGPNRSLMNPYFMNPLVDPNMLSAFLASGLGGNMMDPLSAMSYLNQVGSYQDVFRQYQSNLSSLTNLASGLNNPGTTLTGISNVSTISTSTSNINTSSNIGNLGNIKGSLDSLAMQQLLSNTTASTSSRPTSVYPQTAKISTSMSLTKDRPSISITPVSTSMSSQQQSHHKPKSNKQPSSSQADSALPVHIPKSLQISPTKSVLHPPSTAAQVSLLKPSVIQQVKSSPPKQMSVPEIRVSKSLTEPQPAHNSSLSYSPLKSNSGTVTTNPTMPQVAHTSMGTSVIMKQQQTLPMNLPNVSRTGTSLQHKLLSKKNLQRPYSAQTNVQNHPVRKIKSTMKTTGLMSAPITSSFSNLLNTISSGNSATMSQPPFIPPELSGISVSPVTGPQQSSSIKATSAKYHGYKKTTSKPKPVAPATIEVPPSSLPASFSQNSSVEAFSMLSQLQQHSHLEIIPQQKTVKGNIDYSKNLPSSMMQKIPDSLRPPTSAECLPMYDVSRGKPVPSKKPQDKVANDSVEIITLDD